MRYSAEVHQLAADLAQSEIERSDSLAAMLGDGYADGFDHLVLAVTKERLALVKPQLRETAEADPGFQLDIGADAGYLLGLELGKRLASKDLPEVEILRRAADIFERHTELHGFPAAVPTQPEGA